jgi:hypothetical protein
MEDKEDAIYSVLHFCDYCKKDAIGRLHCSGRDAQICEEIKAKIIKDFSKKADVVDELIEAKPCPFCGGNVYVIEDTFAGIKLGDYYIKCPTCNIVFSKGKEACSRDRIVKCFNKRFVTMEV